MMMRELGAIRREPMQLLVTGILSDVHSCLEEMFFILSDFQSIDKVEFTVFFILFIFYFKTSRYMK